MNEFPSRGHQDDTKSTGTGTLSRRQKLECINETQSIGLILVFFYDSPFNLVERVSNLCEESMET